MTTAILYHQVKPGVDCPDGIAAAYIAYRKMPFPHSTDLIGCVYGEEPPNLENYRNIVIVDFSDLARSIDIDPQPLLFALFDSLVPLTQAEIRNKLAPLGAKLLAPKREKIMVFAIE